MVLLILKCLIILNLIMCLDDFEMLFDFIFFFVSCYML